MNITPKKIEITPIQNIIPEPEFDQIQINTNIPQSEKIVKSLEPKSVNSDLNTVNILNSCDSIPDLDKLKEKLIKLGIRFNTDPKLYQKRDYWLLICILYQALTHLYESNPGDVIVTDWLEEPSDTYVPSEKLVKETLDQIVSDVDGSIFATNTKLNQEIENRESEISRVDESISDINDLIPSEATSSNQLADKQFVHDQIATNASNFRGDWASWASVPSDHQYYPEDYTGNKKPNNNDYLIIQNATDYDPSNTGIWRFVYKGDWDTLGKSGWEPQYRVEQAFTPEQLNAINSGINSTKVSTYDGYLPLILAAL